MLLSSTIRGIRQQTTKIGSFFVHFRSFLSFSGICGQLLTLALVAKCLASQILLDPENRRTLASQTQITEISSIMLAVITWDQVIGLPDRVTPYALWEPNQLLDSCVVSRDLMITQSHLLTRITNCLITLVLVGRLSSSFWGYDPHESRIRLCDAATAELLTCIEL